MQRDMPGDEDAPCLVATLMFAMARRFLVRPGGSPASAAVAIPRPSSQNQLTA